MTYNKEYTLHNGQKIYVQYDEHNISKITKECIEMLIDLYQQGRADEIDEYKEEVLSRFCERCDQYACNGAMIGSRQECTTICMLRDVCTDIANELKEQKK